MKITLQVKRIRIQKLMTKDASRDILVGSDLLKYNIVDAKATANCRLETIRRMILGKVSRGMKHEEKHPSLFRLSENPEPYAVEPGYIQAILASIILSSNQLYKEYKNNTVCVVSSKGKASNTLRLIQRGKSCYKNKTSQ
jgi:hypothetical protein